MSGQKREYDETFSAFDAVKEEFGMTDDFAHLPPELARVCRALEDLYREISPRDYPKHSGMTIIYLERAEAALAAARQYRPEGQWYVGSMNGAFFVIDKLPHPAPMDEVLEGGDTTVICPCGTDKQMAERIVECHNATLHDRKPGADALDDIDLGQMNVTAWVNSGIDDLCAFGQWWSDRHEEDPAQYPASMVNSTWEQRFRDWFRNSLKEPKP